MSRNLNSVLAALVFAGLALFWAADGAEAFCVYNETDTVISATQKSNHKTFKGFDKSIPVGEKRCCNWQNEDCNKEGKKDSIIKFDVYHTGPISLLPVVPGPVPIYTCSGFKIKADGRITVKGKDGRYRCEEGE